MTKRTFKFSINGVPHEVQAEEDTPLIYVLRNDLELKGTRFGCGVNQCGACHVLIDGHSVPACDTPVWAAEGKKIVTVEGLSAEGRLHPLQQAFIEAQAAQCGYCISGILVTAAAFLENNPRPSDAQVREALDKHLCRCGSHNRIVRAVLRAADMMKDQATA
jgi:nicotinate dehydrogenase subunit A